MPYTLSSRRTHLAGGVSALGIQLSGIQILSAQKAIAHAGHQHGTNSDKPAETQPNNAASDESPSGSTADDQNATNSASQQNNAAIETTPTAAQTDTAQPGLLSGISVGLGEALLCLIIAGPFLLQALRKQSHKKRT